VHRDLKPVNFLVKNGAYKLCDFGSATFGHVDLRTPSARSEAEEVIQKTTTQMFRAPEMVDLFMAKKLTQATDVWALGCCLYSLAFFSNCFEEGSNLAILSRKYKIPDDNPYGEGLVELIDRMLTVDAKARADMTEVILCLSAIYSGRPLPPRKRQPKKKEKSGSGPDNSAAPKVGAYRTDGQGIHHKSETTEPKKPAEAKKLDPNSAAARRKRAVKQQSTGGSDGNKNNAFEASFSDFMNTKSEAAADAFGQSGFPAFGDVPAPAGPPEGGAFDDAFDTNKAFFDNKPSYNGKGDLSSSFATQASIRDRRDDGKKGSRSKAPFKK
jgi:serine/threonine protein kinase